MEKTVIEFPDYLSKNAISFIEGLIKKDPQDRISSDLILDHPFLKNAQTKMDIRKHWLFLLILFVLSDRLRKEFYLRIIFNYFDSFFY